MDGFIQGLGTVNGLLGAVISVKPGVLRYFIIALQLPNLLQPWAAWSDPRLTSKGTRRCKRGA